MIYWYAKKFTAALSSERNVDMTNENLISFKVTCINSYK